MSYICNHELVVNNSLWPLMTQIWTDDGLFEVLLLFKFKYAKSCHVDYLDSTHLAICLLIHIWECALNWFTVGLVHKRLLDMCHLRGLRACNCRGGNIYILHMHYVDLYVPMIPNWYKNFHDIQNATNPKHL